jgi:Zn-dependent peptidase ImmA (M78 family)
MSATWGAWIPQRQTIALALDLTAAQARCTLAHHVEHALADHRFACGTGPHADSLGPAALFSPAGFRQEQLADLLSARRLMTRRELDRAMTAHADTADIAAALVVTERALQLRLRDLQGEGGTWPPAKSKTAG